MQRQNILSHFKKATREIHDGIKFLRLVYLRRYVFLKDFFRRWKTPMPVTFKHVPLDHIVATVETLRMSCEKLASAVRDARLAQNKKGEQLPSLILAWTDATETAISTVTGLGSHAVEELDDRVSCWKRGVLCKREKQLLKSRKDVAARKRRQEDSLKPKPITSRKKAAQ